MDIIEKARELGKLIQQEESYIALQKHRQTLTQIWIFKTLSAILI